MKMELFSRRTTKKTEGLLPLEKNVDGHSGRTRQKPMSRRTLVVVTTALFLVGILVVLGNMGNQEDDFLLSKRVWMELKQKQQQEQEQEPLLVSASPPILRSDLRAVSAGQIWSALIQRAVDRQSNNNNEGEIQRVLEVGMHRATQCLQAAQAGLEAHCVEPSPGSFQIIQKAVQAQPDIIQQRIHLYQKVAGDRSGQEVEFLAGGGTGDHVGTADVWNMKVEREDVGFSKKEGRLVQVPTIRIDDIIKDQKFFLLKIDTQGFEPAVFSGLEQALSSHKADYILTEFWPKGMDLHFNAISTKDRCRKAVEILQKLSKYGYQIYPLRVEAHPRAPSGVFRDGIAPGVEQRPMEDFSKHCLWYYELEEKFPSDIYRMGYWTDVLAVAPGITVSHQSLPKEPKVVLQEVVAKTS